MGLSGKERELEFEGERIPHGADFGFEEGDERVGEELMPFHVGEHGIDVVGLLDFLWRPQVIFVHEAFHTVNHGER